MEISMIEFEPIEELAADSSGDLKDLLASWLARKMLLENHKKTVDRQLEEVTGKVEALIKLIGNPFSDDQAREKVRRILGQVQKDVKAYDAPKGHYFEGYPYRYLSTEMAKRVPVTQEEVVRNAEKIVDLLVTGTAMDALPFRLRVEFNDNVAAFLDHYAGPLGLVKLPEVEADV